MPRNPLDVTEPAEEAMQFARSLGFDVVKAADIGSLSGKRLVKRCFRLDLGDGRMLKVRRLRSPERAAEIEAILAAVNHPCFPKALARRDSLLLESWIDGSCIDAGDPDAAERCGSLLGEFHSRSMGRHISSTAESSVDEMTAHLSKACHTLLAARFLSDQDIEAIMAMARRHRPNSADTGYIHADLAPENVIVDHQARFVVIDNESVLEHPYA
jgi:hypothetical protein